MIDMTQLHPVTIKPDWGRWTRVNRHKPDEKSIIDYVLTSKEITRNVSWVMIDVFNLT